MATESYRQTNDDSNAMPPGSASERDLLLMIHLRNQNVGKRNRVIYRDPLTDREVNRLHAYKFWAHSRNKWEPIE